MKTPRRNLLIVLLILGLPVLLLSLAAFGGHLLPAVYEGTVTWEIPAPPARVFELLRDPDRVAVSGASATSIERLDPIEGRVQWRENLGSTTITVVITEAEPPRRLVRTLEDAVVPMKGRHELRLEPSATGTNVTVDYRYEVEAVGTGAMFRVLLWMGGARRGVSEHLSALAAAAR